MLRRSFASLGLAFLLALPMAHAQESAKVQINVQVPAKVASFSDRQLEVLLFEYDPLLADAAATLLDKHLKPFSHESDKDTSKVVVLGTKAKINPKMRYYVTVFVVDAKANRTQIGEKDGRSGLCTVAPGDKSSKVTVIVRSVK